MASTPIQPYGDLDSTLRAMAGRAEGFGRLAIGGLHGPLYLVTSLSGFFFFSFLSLNLSFAFPYMSQLN